MRVFLLLYMYLTICFGVLQIHEAKSFEMSEVFSMAADSIVTVIDSESINSIRQNNNFIDVETDNCCETDLSYIERQTITPNIYGSGFIFHPEGYVLTAAHVINDSQFISIITRDNTIYHTEILKIDKDKDLAVLKIIGDFTSYNYLTFSMRNDLKVGNQVIAIGSPYNYRNTVSSGIISNISHATNSDIETDIQSSYIQTDININPGNSGGPLLDTHGEVVGMNTSIFSPTGSSIGISFATPAFAIYPYIEPYFQGATFRNYGFISDQVSLRNYENLGLARPVGLLLRKITEGSPLEECGFEIGDVIVSADGEIIESENNLLQIIRQNNDDNSIKINVIRSGRYYSAHVNF